MGWVSDLDTPGEAEVGTMVPEFTQAGQTVTGSFVRLPREGGECDFGG